MICSILSVNMSSSNQMRALAELSTMTDEPIDSDSNLSDNSTLKESIWHTLSFEIVQKIKGIFLVWPLRGFNIDFRLGLIEFASSLLVLHFFLEKSGVYTLRHFSLTLSSLDILCKKKPPNIMITYEPTKMWVQNPSGGLFTFCIINV